MVTQKMISLKLDVVQLSRLDDLCSSLGVNRNKLINFMVSEGINLLEKHVESRLVFVYADALKEFL